ncbi:MAG: hypothetical protein WD426_11690 [Anditalea sp.]
MWWARRLFLFFVVVLGVSFFASGQQPTCRWVNIEAVSNGFLLDSLSALEGTITVKDNRNTNLPFEYNINSGFIKIEMDQIEPDSVEVCYRRLPYSLHQVYSKRTLLTDYDSTALFKDKREATTEGFDFREEVFPQNNLNKSGNLTRGISFGNSQNVFVNSSLNLQMEGQLTENLNIRASITDQNVPFQPEGNTQQLQDFDNVLLELYNDQMSLSAGDVVLRQRQSEFLRYHKNVQGLLFTSDYQVNKKWKASTQAGASIAKGKFASTELDVLEGVLGPYRIKGPENERFVIIMANSEKVFLDGKLLKRGFNYDYIIDYNQGEITFTTNVVITQYSRIRIDFEYAERNFSRSILTASHIQESDKVSFYLNFYREQDNRNRSLFFELSNEDKTLLAGVGDNLDAAVMPRVDSIAFDPNRILYEKIISIDDEGKEINHYEYSTDPEEAFFAISFTETGRGEGDYRRQQQLANGVVYEYVAPINGMAQGNYSINSTLPAPNKKQMITAGTRVKLSAFEQVYAEVALSDNDVNLFSDLNGGDDKGYAIKSGFLSHRSLGWLKGYKLNSMAELEYNSANFSFIDRYRYIEFDRDWSLSQEDMELDAAERLMTAQVELVKDVDNLASYELNLRNRGEVLSGFQQAIKVNQQIGERLFLINDLFFLNSRIQALESNWIRYNGTIQYRSKAIIPGYRFNIDRNKVAAIASDSIVNTAMNFLEHQVFLKSNDTLSYSFFGDASWREDKYPIEGNLLPSTRAFTTNYGLQKKFGLHEVKGTFTYRKLAHFSRGLPDETSIMGRLDYRSNLSDNNIRNELSYAIGNGRELRREFIFLPVPTGEGTHTWRDDNGDGVQQLNEFYLAVNPEEKNFIKIFVPTDEYILAYTTLFNYRLNAKFPDSWRNKNGLQLFLHNFSNNTSWNVEKKVSAIDFISRISPFTKGIANEDLISTRQTFRSTVFFNRSSPKYGFDASFFNSQHKQLLSGGFEDLVQKDWKLNTRFNFNQTLNLHISMNNGTRMAASDFLDNRNYEVDQYTFGPEIIWQPTSYFRGSTDYSYTHKRNLGNTEMDEKAALNQFGLNLRYAKAIKTTLNAQLKYTNISYNGQANSPTGYEMLQALTVGDNYIWGLNWLQKIGEGLQLNMTYEGRNSEGLDRLVHTGRMQVSALF